MSINIVAFLLGLVLEAKMTHPAVYSTGTYAHQTILPYLFFNSASYFSFVNPGIHEVDAAAAPDDDVT